MRKLLVLTHRWMSIVGGLLFIPWLISGIVFTFWSMPSFRSVDRLEHLTPLDLSTARVEPLAAAQNIGITPTRLRVATYYDGRPVYRFQGTSAVYADTGEAVPGRTADQALALVRQFEPAHAATVRYDRLLDDIDLWTAGSRGQMPLHKIAVGDPRDTYYYISEKSGEPVMKTDRSSRFWGFSGEVLHLWYFTALRKNEPLYDRLIFWGATAGMLICLSGLIVGVWQMSITRRFRKKGKASFSPYSGWLLWHHYAGLIFGVITFTWIFSGALSSSYYQGPSIDPTAAQRAVTTGGPIDFGRIRLEDIRKSLNAVTPSFRPKEADILQFRGRPYLRAADGPLELPVIGGTVRDWDYKPSNYRMVWLDDEDHATFKRFDDHSARAIADEAMPGVSIVDATWIQEYDAYYRMGHYQPLPVLRVKYANPTETWLYIDPQRGTIALSVQQHNRNRRWLYNGLHKFDLPWIYDYDRRGLWAASIVVLSIGGLVLSTTTVVPMFRRLARHANRLVRPAKND